MSDLYDHLITLGSVIVGASISPIIEYFKTKRDRKLSAINVEFQLLSQFNELTARCDGWLTSPDKSLLVQSTTLLSIYTMGKKYEFLRLPAYQVLLQRRATLGGNLYELELLDDLVKDLEKNLDPKYVGKAIYKQRVIINPIPDEPIKS